jgi:hypothetical protein
MATYAILSYGHQYGHSGCLWNKQQECGYSGGKRNRFKHATKSYSYSTLDGQLQHSGWSVTAFWMVSYSTLDGQLEHSGWSVTALWLVSYSTLDGQLQHSGWSVTSLWMVSYSTMDGHLHHSEWSVTLWMG